MTEPATPPVSTWLLMWRLLTFRITREELLALNHRDLVFGLLVTWFVGIGRWWDHPTAGLAQRSGLGSVAYVFVFALFLWILYWRLKLKVEGLSFRRILTFISLTAAPAILYAIPVESVTSPVNAMYYNYGALAVVALWRVALLYNFLTRLGADFRIVLQATFVPLLIILVVLAAMNAQGSTVDLMAGHHRPLTAEESFQITFALAVFLFYLFAFCVLIVYLAVTAGLYLARRMTVAPDPIEPAFSTRIVVPPPSRCDRCGKGISVGITCRDCLLERGPRHCSCCGQEILAGSLCQFCQFRGSEGST